MKSIQNPDGSTIDAADLTDLASTISTGISMATGIPDIAAALKTNPFDQIANAVKLYITLIEFIMAKIGPVLSEGQGLNTTEFYNVVSVVVSDLLGVEIDKRIVDQSSSPETRVAASAAVGSALYDQLANEFTQGGPLSEEQGKKGAQAFLGFLMSFAIREGNMAILGDIPEVPFLEHFRDYGENMAKYLGLGRQARAALKPLITTTIATPLQWNLNRQYRPTKLSEAIFAKALAREKITPEEFQTEMERLGYSDKYIAIMKEAGSRLLSDTEIAKLYALKLLTPETALKELQRAGFSAEDAERYLSISAKQLAEGDLIQLVLSGDMDETSAISYLELLGFDHVTAVRKWKASLGSRTSNEIDAYTSELVALAKAQVIDRETARGLIEQLPLDATEKKWINSRIGLALEYPARVATLAQMEAFYTEGLIDLDTFRDWLIHKGYGPDERTWYIQGLLLKLDKAKAPKPKKGLSLSELRKAFKAAEISIEQFTAGAAALGYSPESVQIFVEELTATG